MKDIREHITQEQLKDEIYYYPETGIFRKTRVFRREVVPGRVVGTANSSGGYRYIQIKIGGKKYPAHRLAYLYMRGVVPDFRIVHKNGKKDDNRWANLTHRILNGVDKKAGSEYGSGLVGVNWVKGSGKWMARIELNGKSKHLGMFTELEDALNARKEANAHYGVVSVANTDCGLIEYNRDEETLKIIKEFEQERRELEDTIKAREEANARYALTQEQA